jgi:hypothetical protein
MTLKYMCGVQEIIFSLVHAVGLRKLCDVF